MRGHKPACSSGIHMKKQNSPRSEILLCMDITISLNGTVQVKDECCKVNAATRVKGYCTCVCVAYRTIVSPHYHLLMESSTSIHTVVTSKTFASLSGIRHGPVRAQLRDSLYGHSSARDRQQCDPWPLYPTTVRYDSD